MATRFVDALIIDGSGATPVTGGVLDTNYPTQRKPAGRCSYPIGPAEASGLDDRECFFTKRSSKMTTDKGNVE